MKTDDDFARRLDGLDGLEGSNAADRARPGPGAEPEVLAAYETEAQVHGLLRTALRSHDETAFARGIVAEIVADDRHFVAGVMRDVRREAIRRRRLRLSVPVAAAAVLIIGVGLFAFAPRTLGQLEPLVRIATPGSECSVRRAGRRIPIDEQQPLYVGDTVTTGDLPVVLYRRGEHLYLFPRSRLTLAAKAWRLEHGALRMTTDAARNLITEHATVAVAPGSAFLEHSALGSLVRVDDGRAVLTDPDGARTELTAGCSEMVMVPPDMLDADAYVTGR